MNNTPKLISVKCFTCGISFSVFKSRYDKSKYKKFYHNSKCYSKSARSTSVYSESKHIIINCSGCGIVPIDIFKKEYENSNTKNFYHDRDCFMKHGNYKGCGKGKSLYLDNYRCRDCNKFFNKSEAIPYTSKNGKRKYLVCPNPNCGKYPLKQRPRNSKRSGRLREQLKEQQQEQIPLMIQQQNLK